MSSSSPFEEHTATERGPVLGDGHFVFEDKSLVCHEDEVQQELEEQLADDTRSNVSATVLWKHVVKGKKCGNAHGGSHVFKCIYCHKMYHDQDDEVFEGAIAAICKMHPNADRQDAIRLPISVLYREEEEALFAHSQERCQKARNGDTKELRDGCGL